MRLYLIITIFCSGLVFAILLGSGCQQKPAQTGDTSSSKVKSSEIPLSEVRLKPMEATMDNPYFQAAAAIQKRHSDKIMGIEGITGIGVTLLEDGRIAFQILTKSQMTPETNSELPKEIEGLPVRYKVSGEIIAQ